MNIPKKNIKKSWTVRQGTKPKRNSYTVIYNKNVKLIDDDTGELVAIFLKNVIPDKYIKIGRELISFKGTSTARGAYAGETKKRKTLTGKKSQSSVVGYLLPYLVKDPKPQLSKATKQDIDLYNGGLKDLYKYVDTIIKKIDPKGYSENLVTIKNMPSEYKISKIVSNVQINVDQIAHYHVDNGNANKYGTLMAFYPSDKPFKGGEFVLGEYNICFTLREGDLLYTNQFSPHGTFSISGNRISAVGFQSKKLINYFNK